MYMLCLAPPREVCYYRKDIRNMHLYVRDGLSGTCAVDNVSGYMAGASTIHVDTVVTNTDANEGGVANQIPVGARLLIKGKVYKVTDASDSVGDWDLDISPNLADALTDDDSIDILPQMTEVKIGEGNITYSEQRNVEYEYDRDRLDTARLGQDVPLELNMDFAYEWVKASSGDPPTPEEAIKCIGAAASYITSAIDDPCAPKAVDIILLDDVPCGNEDDEILIFKDFRWTQLDHDVDAASISCTGTCLATEAEPFRGTIEEYEASLLE